MLGFTTPAKTERSSYGLECCDLLKFKKSVQRLVNYFKSSLHLDRLNMK